jgi:hypothetical protein
MINVFLDDLRKCPEGFTLARDYSECILLLSECEVNILSLDHDLGEGEPNGYDVAKWIVKNNRWPRRIRFHTANPVGRSNMIQLLQRYAPEWVEVEIE